MQTEPAILSLTVRNLLSFGEEARRFELRSLNVLIGSNGSGKSNLIEVIGLLQNAPKELGTAISNGGPIEEWLWKGSAKTPVASIEAIVNTAQSSAPINKAMPIRYRLEFTRIGFRFEITDEAVENERPWPDKARPYIYYAFGKGRPMLNYRGDERTLRQEEINPQLSILAQRKDPEHYPEITYLGDLFAQFKLYRDWEFGSIADIRQPCDVGLPGKYLEEDASNLGAVLDNFLARPPVKHQILEHLQTFYENTKDLRTNVEGSKIQTRLEEKYLKSTVPLSRMSDGTIRWLSLLAILLNPEPPALVCIEEPELGLHPDMIPELAKLLISASTRMQLIVTTHSDRLIEAFTDRPEAVVVCEKQNGASTFQRLDGAQLSSWLKQYSLGELWTRGQIGGTRW